MEIMKLNRFQIDMCFWRQVLSTWMFCLNCACARPFATDPLTQTWNNKMVDYLKRYNYVTPDASLSLKDFNEMTRLLSIELLGYHNDDEDTARLLHAQLDLPRCAKDGLNQTDNQRRRKRFVGNTHKWQFTNLSWKFRDPLKLFKKDEHFQMAKKVIGRAFSMWSGASNGVLTFTELAAHSINKADIDLYFARGDHDDFEAFDGKGGIVAHSGYPMDGQVHFDASELWSTTGKRGVDLRYVSTHELGHALGLRHSSDRHAIMHPVYKAAKTIALSEDDVLGIRHLYKGHIHKNEAIRRAKMRYRNRERTSLA